VFGLPGLTEALVFLSTGGAVATTTIAAPPVFQIVTKARCLTFACERIVETGHAVGAREGARNTHRRDEAFV
jgi:hypothetical protein